METLKIRIKKTDPRAVIPTKAHPTDVGYDLTAIERSVDEYGNINYRTGLAFEIPEGVGGFIFPRSSNNKRPLMLANAVAVIDPPYRGEVWLKFKPTMRMEYDGAEGLTPEYMAMCADDYLEESYEVGDRIAQIVFLPFYNANFIEVEKLSETDRGESGNGGSGK